MTKPKLKILKLRKFADGLTESEEDKLLKKHKCRRLTPREFLTADIKKIRNYTPCRIQILNDPVVRGLKIFRNSDWHYVYVGGYYPPSDRLGVLGMKIKRGKK